MYARRPHHAWVVIVLALAACTPSVSDSGDEGEVLTTARAATGCIPSGTNVSIQDALVGDGASAVLCPGATFQIDTRIDFTAPRQQIYTQGFPTGNTRALLIKSRGNDSAMIRGYGLDGIALKSIRVDGNVGALGHADDDDDASIEIGKSKDIVVDSIDSRNTRSWSCLHLHGGGVEGEKRFSPAMGAFASSFRKMETSYSTMSTGTAA